MGKKIVSYSIDKENIAWVRAYADHLDGRSASYVVNRAISSARAAVEAKQLPVKKKESVKRFVPPVASMVLEYMMEKGLSGIDSATESGRFVDHYTSNGWKVGRNKMKDWKAAVRNWLKGKPTQQKASADNWDKPGDNWHDNLGM